MSHSSIYPILQFWHAVEFFSPFDLDEAISKKHITAVTQEQLLRHGDNILPWLSDSAKQKIGVSLNKDARYALYLLPFNKNELTKIVRLVYPTFRSDGDNVAQEDALDDAGKTCFVKLNVSEKGMPLFDEIGISTLPWAMGKLLQNQIIDLCETAFNKDMILLKSELDLVANHLYYSQSETTEKQTNSGELTAYFLNILLTIFKKWSRFSPDHPIAFFISVTAILPKKTEHDLLTFSENQTDKIMPAKQDEAVPINTAKEKITIEPDILNSFFITDIEKIMLASKMKPHPVLMRYVMGIEERNRRCLFSGNHNQLILDTLMPRALPSSRWVSRQENEMALMQQFAINQSLGLNEALFSINGPPGTGKTTLLQDIIAQNITNRAAVLAQYDYSEQAFSGKRCIQFSGNTAATISVLDKKLTGFEMLVVSSNNTAVENISKDFPLKSKVGTQYQDNACYLKAVAGKVFATHDKNQIIPIEQKDSPWGLISIALGNATNRNQFRDRVFFAPEARDSRSQKIKEARIKAGEYLTIWEWRNQYEGDSFVQAKEKFIEAQRNVNHYINDIEQLRGIIQEKNKCVAHLLALKKRKDELESQYKIILANMITLKTDLAEIVQNKYLLQTEIDLHIAKKPNIFCRIFNTVSAKLYKKILMDLEKEVLLALKSEESYVQSIVVAEKIIDDFAPIQSKMLFEKQYTQTQYEKLSKECSKKIAQLPGVVLPPESYEWINIEDIQKRAVWQNTHLNHLRTTLFIASLNLHEAWLAEVLKSKQFSGNVSAISHLLENRKTVIDAEALLVWQSFFMWIPVISSTFASIGRQFNQMPAHGIGWLLIDEAGQATPQSAVGAIWRAKNVVVVGDPLQIEPVVTIPNHLIVALAKQFLCAEYEKWLPHCTSVQILSDHANMIGAYYIDAGENTKWIGSPLRVHRRCADPMFSIANEIAYAGKMIQARGAQSDIKNEIEPSGWYNITGEVTDKQYVQAQGEIMLSLLIALYQYENKLPDVYIITPFRRIKNQLQSLIQERVRWFSYLSEKNALPKQSDLNEWCQKNIGTIHTFQGKEAHTVFLVLGADKDHQGSANWASRTPNLLNVALTRAKERVYIIGDYSLWASKPYFAIAAQYLPIKDCNKNYSLDIFEQNQRF
jgi:hypothetical protein